MSEGGFDPVEDFFAREREAVVPTEGDDLHWQGIVRDARSRGSARTRGYLTGAAAAAVVVAAVAWGATTGGPGSRSGPTAPVARSTTAATATTVRPPAVAPVPSAAPPAATPGVPASFRVRSLTNVGGGHLFALGSAGCGTRSCPTLVGSRDGGASWTLVTRFPDAAPAREDDPAGVVQAPTALGEVRFATPQLGWVYGGGLKVTRDGGQTWREVPHEGATTLDLETDGTSLVVTSANGCDAQSCSGPMVVSRADLPSGRPVVVGRTPTGGRVSGSAITFDGGVPFVSPRWAVPPATGGGPLRVGLSALQPLAVPPGCEAPWAGIIVTGNASPVRGLTALCGARGGGGAGQMHLAVSASTNGGRSWAMRTDGGLQLVNAGLTSAAAADPEHLLAVSGGDPALHGSMRVSADGGRTWRPPSAGPPVPERGWRWVGAPGGRTFYAVPVGAGPSYWQSDDDGEHWHEVRLR